MLARAMRVKIELIEQDPFEGNVRAHLNLGHTFGHALETLSGYSIRHGEAVAIGIATASRLAARTGFSSTETEENILSRMRQLCLPTAIPRGMTAADIRSVMQRDKKVRNKSLRLVLPRAIGHVEIVDGIPDGEIEAALIESGATRA